MPSVDTILKNNCFPESFLQAAQNIFPETVVFGVMLEIAELCHLLQSDDLRDHWLISEESHRLQSFKLEKRRNEWLTGRICAKLAAGMTRKYLTLSEFRDIVVVNSSEGRPSIAPLPSEKSHRFDISISHSGNLAVALFADVFCGVDVQITSSTLQRVKERFCTTNDEAALKTFLDGSIEPTELNLLWTAKEAIRKTLSFDHVPDFLNLSLSSLEAMSSNHYVFHFSYKDITVSTLCGSFQNYCLALCLYRGPANA